MAVSFIGGNWNAYNGLPRITDKLYHKMCIDVLGTNERVFTTFGTTTKKN
jgi:hypothetical protein